MKKCFTFFFLLFQLQLFSQISYQHYLNYSVKWARTFSAPYHFETHNYYILGDTIVGGQWYYKVNHKYRFTDSYSVPQQEYYGDDYTMAIREDSLKRFWRLDKNDTAAYLWYDFNLSPADSINGSPITFTDTIYFNGEPRQRFHNNTYNILIEGIGMPDRGTYSNSIQDIMHCFFKDTAVYSYDGNCYIISSVDANEPASFKYYPNPATGILFVEAEEIISAVTLSDLAGKTVITKTLSEKKSSLDVSLLSKGLYFLQVNTGQKRCTQKLVLQ